jgi:hypothetical protein
VPYHKFATVGTEEVLIGCAKVLKVNVNLVSLVVLVCAGKGRI